MSNCPDVSVEPGLDSHGWPIISFDFAIFLSEFPLDDILDTKNFLYFFKDKVSLSITMVGCV